MVMLIFIKSASMVAQITPPKSSLLATAFPWDRLILSLFLLHLISGGYLKGMNRINQGGGVSISITKTG